MAELEAAWQAGQAAMADALGGRLVVAEATGHSIAGENPGLVVELVSEVIASVPSLERREPGGITIVLDPAHRPLTRADQIYGSGCDPFDVRHPRHDQAMVTWELSIARRRSEPPSAR